MMHEKYFESKNTSERYSNARLFICNMEVPGRI